MRSVRLAAILALAASSALAIVPPAGRSGIAEKLRSYPPFHVFPAPVPVADVLDRLPNADALRKFSAAHPQEVLHVDPVSGRIAGGKGSIPWVPGAGNSLTADSVAWAFDGPKAAAGIPELDTIARRFIADNADVFRIPQGVELLRNDVASTKISGSLSSLWYDAKWNGLPIEGASVVFVVKHGNLILWSVNGLDDVDVPAAPVVSAESARSTVGTAIGGFLPGRDFDTAPFELRLVPVRGEGFRGYKQVWQLGFRRDGDGVYTARVDAVTGELLELADAMQWAQVKGGVFPRSPTVTPEVSRPFGYADWKSGQFADAGGAFVTGTGTNLSSLTGKYVKISDDCGGISLSVPASPGDLDFGTSAGTDCVTPGFGGAGNTHSARSCYYHIDLIKQKGRSQLAGTPWLLQQLTANVNINNQCNAGWNGSTVNFFRSGGGCGNTGEIAGVFLHEWGHGMDQFDGNGAQGSGEAMGDTVAMLQLRDSCIGPGFFGSACDGYGNPCTTCSGVREQDYMKHSTHEVLTPKNIDARCPSGSDPCGNEVHCEGQLVGNAVWDLAYRDLPARADLDVEDAWQVADKLWWQSGPFRTFGYTCGNSVGAPWNNGCGSTTWFQTFLAVDDDNGNLADGTPHASTIFAAFDRHGISCGTATSPANLDHTDCPAIGAPGSLVLAAGNDSIALTWLRATGADEYRILRNNLDCDSGFIEIARVADTGAPSQSFLDTAASNGVTWNYRVQPVGPNPDCVGPTTACASGMPTGRPDLRVVAAVQTADSGDDDGWPDDCETVTVRVDVRNTGTSNLTGVVIGNLGSLHAGVTLLTPLPIPVGSIAAGATGSATFQYRLGDGAGNASCAEILNFEAFVAADQVSAAQLGTFSFVAEQDLLAAGNPSWSFETDLDGWTVESGSFSRTTSTAQDGAFSLTSTIAKPYTCDVVRSPLLVPANGSTVTLATHYWLQPYSGGWGDRANLAVYDPATGTRTVLIPASGRPYDTDNVGGSCVVNGQKGWAGKKLSWGDSTFDLSAFAGTMVQIEVATANDGSITGDAFRFDNVRTTNVRIVSCDLQADTCSACAAAPVITGEPQFLGACTGTAASLSVEAVAATGYQWWKDGAPVSGQTSATFSLPSPAAGDAGSYWCVVTNGCGSTETEHVAVEVHPFASVPPNAAVLVSPTDGSTTEPIVETFTFTVDTRSALDLGTTNPPPFYQAFPPYVGTRNVTVTLAPATTYYWKVVTYPLQGAAPPTSTSILGHTTVSNPSWTASVSPTTLDRFGGTVPFTVTGNGFSAGSTVTLVGPDGVPGGGTVNVTSVTPTTLTGTFTPDSTAKSMRWDVQVDDGAGGAVGSLQAVALRAFIDVAETDFFFTAAERMVTLGLLPGAGTASAPEFQPTRLVLRSEMADALVRAHFLLEGASVPDRTCRGYFPDVPCEHPQRLGIEWAKDLGIALGGVDGTFQPSSNLTRAEMAAFLDRLAFGSDSAVPKCDTDPGWADAASIPGWATAYVNTLYGQRITAGCSASPLMYCPLGSVQRSELATFLARVVGEVPKP